MRRRLARVADVGVPMLPADPGRPVTDPDERIGRSELVVFETPPASGALSDFPIAFVAGSTDGAWKPVPIELNLGVQPLSPIALRRQASIGKALSVLDARTPMIIDELSSVTVKLISHSAVLLNADDEALMAGANLALLGEELIQFGRAEEIAPDIFRISRLLRGRRGTEWAAGTHRAGEIFCFINQNIQPIETPPGAVGTALIATAHGIGDTAPLPEAQRILSGEAMRPPSPCHLTLWSESGGLRAEWIRRSHRGWDWLDEVGVPEDPFAELYRVTIEGPVGQVIVETAASGLFRDWTDLPAAGGETVLVTVSTVGPRAVSHGISATLTL